MAASIIIPSRRDIPMEQHASLKKLSAATDIAESTYRDWIARGLLQAYKLPGGQVRVRVADVKALFTPVEPKQSAA
jgi:excisionase family DNA binding protein